VWTISLPCWAAGDVWQVREAHPLKQGLKPILHAKTCQEVNNPGNSGPPGTFQNQPVAGLDRSSPWAVMLRANEDADKMMINLKTGEPKRMNTMAVVRADDISKVKIALYDLLRYANLTFSGTARKLDPTFADNILTQIMKCPLRACCSSAAIVPLEDQAIVAIARIRKIHPPAHVIIVSPRHEIYYELVNYVDILPEIELTFDQTSVFEPVSEMAQGHN